jgi:predicted DNA-binding transcriptional regulator AlpA
MSDKTRELEPNQIIRMGDGPRYFGYKSSQLDLKIKSGEVPAPIFLGDTGRARGWTGQQILDHQQRLLARKRA